MNEHSLFSFAICHKEARLIA